MTELTLRFDDGSNQILGSASDIVAGSICRFKTDMELAEWNFKSRSDPTNPRYTGLNWSPCTIRLNGGDGVTVLSPAWQNRVASMNSPEAFKYLKRAGSGWVNKPRWPTIQELSFVGLNLVYVTRVDGEKVYIRSLDATKPPPIVLPPYTVHVFTVIDPEGKILSPDTPALDGNMVFIPIISDRELWIERHKLVLVA